MKRALLVAGIALGLLITAGLVVAAVHIALGVIACMRLPGAHVCAVGF